MHQSEYETSVGIHAPAIGLGLWYDAEKLILEGIYLDEVSAYRARRSWIKTFEMNFLLEEIPRAVYLHERVRAVRVLAAHAPSGAGGAVHP